MTSNNHDNLKKKAFGGMFWVFSERVCGKLVSMVVTIVLARLLLPEDYSVINIVTIFYTLCTVVVTCGMNTALLQKKDADMQDYSTALCLTMGLAAVMYILVFFTAPLIAGIYDKPLLVPVFRVMGLSLFIHGFKTVLNAYTFGGMEFRRFFLCTIAGSVASAVIGIALAWLGFGAWALVAQQMVDLFVDTLVLYFSCRIRLRLRFHAQRFRELFSLGWRNFASTMVSVLYTELNPLVVGLRFSATDLAFYSKGMSFPGLINTTLSEAMSLVLFPVLTKVRDNPEDMLGASRRYMKTASYVVFPVMLGLAAISDTFVRLLLTEKWMDCAVYIRIFCVSYSISIITSGNLEPIRALGRNDVILRLEILKRTISLGLLVTAVLFAPGPEFIAICAAATGAISMVLHGIYTRKLIGYRVRWMLADIIPNLLLSGIMAGAVILAGRLPVPDLLLLLVQLAVGMAVYVGVSALLRVESFHYLLKTFRQMLRR